MRIKIGPYRSDLIPVRNWERRYEMWRSDKYYLDEKDYTWYDKIVMGFFDKFSDLVLPINRWSNNRKRKMKVHIDYYDVWSADHTLAMIIAPTLKKLKEHQHGYPHVDNEDVPEHLQITKEDREKLEHDGTVDSKHEARWNYVLDEMIWAFEQHADPYDNDAQFHHNSDQLEIVFTPLDDGKPGSTLSFNHQKDLTKPAYWVDREGKKNHHERMNNGVRLFAKYYEALWD
jgi:hypothetical protein